MSDGPEPAPALPVNDAGASREPVVRVLKICNQKGLHARAAAKFVQMAEKFDASIRVKGGTCGEPCDGTSILDLLMLGAGPGTTITVEATGPQAAEAVEALAALVSGRFTEEE
jgi:phosphocarrier protein HPr